MAQEGNGVTAGQIVFAVIYLLLCPALLFFLSGDWIRSEDWIFSGWFIAVSSTTYLSAQHCLCCWQEG